MKKAGITRSEKSSKMFEIVQTRTGGFEGLLKALEETNQTGALAILKGCPAVLETSAAELDESTPSRDTTVWNNLIGNWARDTGVGSTFNALFGSNKTHVGNRSGRDVIVIMTDKKITLPENLTMGSLQKISGQTFPISSCSQQPLCIIRKNSRDYFNVIFVSEKGLEPSHFRNQIVNANVSVDIETDGKLIYQSYQ